MTQISFSLLHWLLFLSLNFNQFLNTWPLPCLWASIKPWLVIGWLSHRSWVPLSPFHKSLPRAPQSLLLLFSKLSPICHHIYCFESQNYTDKSRFCSSESHRRGWWWTQEWESLRECQQWHCLIFFFTLSGCKHRIFSLRNHLPTNFASISFWFSLVHWLLLIVSIYWSFPPFTQCRKQTLRIQNRTQKLLLKVTKQDIHWWWFSNDVCLLNFIVS